MSTRTDADTCNWLSHFSEAELTYWNALSQSEKDWWLKNTKPENRQKAIQIRLANIDVRIKQAVLDLNKALLKQSGLCSEVACALRSDERFLSIYGKDRIEINFYWQSGYWNYWKDGCMKQKCGDVMDLIEFMESKKLIPDKDNKKKGQMVFWDS